MVTEALQLSSTVNASLWARHTESEGDDGGVTRPPPPAGAPGRTAGSTRDRLFLDPSWSGGSGLAELFVRMDLSVDFGEPA